MVKKKSGSNRQTLKQKYKIQKRVKEHDRKLKKAAKKGGAAPGKKFKDPGIPNSWPCKAELLAQVEAAKDRKAAKALADKEARKLAKKGGGSGSLADLVADARARGAAHAAAGAPDARAVGAAGGTGDAVTRSARADARDLAKVVESADVILEVLDARDPLGSRSSRVERMVDRSPGKRLILVLNKVDLVPRDVATQWLDRLRSTGLAVVAFKACTQRGGGVGVNPLDKSRDGAVCDETRALASALGVDSLLQLLKNYGRDGSGRPGALVVGVVGFPNAGKSSVIKSLVGSRQGANHGKTNTGACTVSATPGFTKALREVRLDSKLTLIDSPGVVGVAAADSAGRADALASLLVRGCVDAADLGDDAPAAAEALLARADPAALAARYGLPVTAGGGRAFLRAVAQKRGHLKRGGVPNLSAAAADVLREFARGDVKFYTNPPAKLAQHAAATRVDALAPAFDVTDDANILKVAGRPTTDAAGFDTVALGHVEIAGSDDDGDDDDDAMDEAPDLVAAEPYDFARDFQYPK